MEKDKTLQPVNRNYLTKGDKVRMKNGEILTVTGLDFREFTCAEKLGDIPKKDIETVLELKPLMENKIIENGCTCDRCENKYKIDLNLPDELWEKINPVKHKMLCPECIGELLTNLNEFGAYRLTSLTAPVPDGRVENQVGISWRFSNDEIYELGKKEVSYERQLAICGKKEADGVLFFWMEGYKKAIQDLHILTPKTPDAG